MRDSFVRSLLSSASSSDNLIQRIRENFRDALTPGKWKVSSANGASLHLLRFDSSARTSRAQGVSFLTHAAILVALALIAAHPFKPASPHENETTKVLRRLTFPSRLFAPSTGGVPDPGSGSGGAECRFPRQLEILCRSLPFRSSDLAPT
jgi:hypothetical protein